MNILAGNKVEKLCDLCNITVNKNAVFGDSSALAPGGVRVGMLYSIPFIPYINCPFTVMHKVLVINLKLTSNSALVNLFNIL